MTRDVMRRGGATRQGGRSENRLLSLLPERDAARIREAAETVRPALGQPVCEPGEPMEAAYFPTTGVFSAIVPLEDGSAIEAATIGNEGVIGLDFLARGPAAAYRVILQVPGESLRVPAAAFRDLIGSSEPLRRLLETYALTVIRMSGQSAACNLRHPVAERMVRWLLMTHDRAGSDEFFLTQEFLSVMLGVRRQTVSIEAARLQEAGLIVYSRGNVTVLDRPGLEDACCECYAAVRDGYERVMGGFGD